MAEFEFDSSFDDIQKPKPIPEDWYVTRLVKDPFVDLNAAAKHVEAGAPQPGDEEKAGKNMIFDFRTVTDTPETNGRQMRKWISLPNAADAERYTPSGQSVKDFKMEQLQAFIELLGGQINGKRLVIEAGSEIMQYVTIKPGFRNPEDMENSISMNHPARAVE